MSEPLECLDAGPDPSACNGPVEYHINPYSDSFKAWPRCEGHYRVYVDKMQGIAQRYPVNAPSDFDPSYAGERWDDDY